MSNHPDLHFFVEGKQATADDVKEAPITLVSDDLPEGKAIHVFQSQDSFRSWVGRTKHKQRAEMIEGTIAQVRKLEKEDHTRAKKVQKARVKRIERELAELAKDTGLKPGSPELYRRALEAPLLEGPILHTAICHEHWDGTGAAVFLVSAIPIPDFGWLGMNDKTSGLTFLGAGVLSAETWYQGRAFWFFGAHMWWPPMQLSFAGWDNIASSGYCIGP
jgi:hypothetical protein